MHDILPALIGAAATALVMVISNVSNRRERILEISIID